VPQLSIRTLLILICLTGLPCLARAQTSAPPAATPAQSAEDTPFPPPAAPVQVTLPNGMEIVCRKDSTPLVAVDVFVRVGVAQESDADAGISNFVARTILASTADSTPAAMQENIGDLGGNVSSSWQPEWTQISTLTVRDQFQAAILLLSDVLAHADFDRQTVDDTRAQLLSEVDGRDSDLFETDYQGIRSALYPHSGYGLPDGGTLATVQRITREDLIQFYDRYYIPRNFVFVVVGNVDPQKAIRSIESGMDDFPLDRTGRRMDMDPAAPPMPFEPPAPVKIFQPDLAETVVMVGYRVPPASSPDYPTFLVLNALLGGMKTSRMFTDLRDNQGLAYELGSSLNAQIMTGDLTGFVFAPPVHSVPSSLEKIPTVGLLKTQMLAQFTSFKTTPPSPTALARAKHFLIGSYLIKHETIQDRATYLGVSVLTRGTADFDTNYADYINAVTAPEITDAATKYFNNPAIATIEPDAAAMKMNEAAQP
jgi:zinc protease